MSLPPLLERPLSVATTATTQSEAPPPYSEYDDSHVPPPNEQTQAMLRGGYLVRNQRQETPSVREYGPATAYMRGRPYNVHHNDVLTIARAIHPGIKAAGVPFPSEYPAVSERDVTRDDWSYFVNCILRELEVPNTKGAIATPVTVNEFRERQDMVDATVDQWNRGFFSPRGIHIVPAYSFYRSAPTAATETIRSSSPTPTYRTERTMSQDDEIMTITIDTSPRSTRAGTPDTIRELNAGDGNPPGALTPKTVDEQFGSPLSAPISHTNSIPRKPVLRKRPSMSGPLYNQTDEQARQMPYKKSEKQRRDSSSSASSSSSEDSFLSELSSDDELAQGDVPAMRRTLAQEFQRDPQNWSHLKVALHQMRNDIRQQQRNHFGAAKHQRAELKAASKEHRKQMNGEMKQLRREMKGYYKQHKEAKKEVRKNRDQLKKEWKSESRRQRKEDRDARRDKRRGRGRAPATPVTPVTPGNDGLPAANGQPWSAARGGNPNMSMPQLGRYASNESVLAGQRVAALSAATTATASAGRRGGPAGPCRAMTGISFDKTGASPSCVRSRSPRPGTANSANYNMPNIPGLQTLQHMRSSERLGLGERGGFGGRRGVGPIGMARDFLMAQANAGIERLRLDPEHVPPPRAGEDSWRMREDNGQETGIVKR